MDNELIRYLVMVFVVWRVTHLISSEDGPFDIVIRVRKLLGSGFFGRLADCFYCLSIWVGLAAALLAGGDVMTIILMTLYYSGASIFIERISDKNSTD